MRVDPLLDSALTTWPSGDGLQLNYHPLFIAKNMDSPRSYVTCP